MINFAQFLCQLREPTLLVVGRALMVFGPVVTAVELGMKMTALSGCRFPGNGRRDRHKQ